MRWFWFWNALAAAGWALAVLGVTGDVALAGICAVCFVVGSAIYLGLRRVGKEIKLFGPDEYRGLYLVVVEEWSQFFGRANWHTFHPFLLEFEGDWIMGGVEASIVILGVGMRVRWNYTKTELVEEIKRRADEIVKEPVT